MANFAPRHVHPMHDLMQQQEVDLDIHSRRRERDQVIRSNFGDEMDQNLERIFPSGDVPVPSLLKPHRNKVGYPTSSLSRPQTKH